MSLVVTTSSHLGVSKANNGWPEYPSPSTTGYDTIGIMVQKNDKKIIKKFTRTEFVAMQHLLQLFPKLN